MAKTVLQAALMIFIYGGGLFWLLFWDMRRWEKQHPASAQELDELGCRLDKKDRPFNA